MRFFFSPTTFLPYSTPALLVAKRRLPPIPTFGTGYLYPVCPTAEARCRAFVQNI